MKAVIFRSKKNNLWYFHVKARNNRIIMHSEGYNRMGGARKCIQNLKNNGLKLVYIDYI